MLAQVFEPVYKLNLKATSKATHCLKRASFVLPNMFRKEPKNMDPYVDLIVDDIIISLSAYDAHMGEDFKLKANILLHVLDYPGQNKLFKSQRKGLYYIYILATTVVLLLFLSLLQSSITYRCWSIFRMHLLLHKRRIF